MVKTISKKNIAQGISQDLGLSISQSQDMVNDIIEVMIDITRTKGKLKIPHFGSFVTKKQNASTAMHPVKKEICDIPARTIVKFRAASSLKEYINDE